MEERFRKSNAEAKAAGCLCGAPATHVRRSFGAFGTVMPETWTCAAHVNVNSWTRSGDGLWTPAGGYSDADQQWVSGPVKAS